MQHLNTDSASYLSTSFKVFDWTGVLAKKKRKSTATCKALDDVQWYTGWSPQHCMHLPTFSMHGSSDLLLGAAGKGVLPSLPSSVLYKLLCSRGGSQMLLSGLLSLGLGTLLSPGHTPQALWVLLPGCNVPLNSVKDMCLTGWKVETAACGK